MSKPLRVVPLTDAERLKKLESAVALVREVEFSYPEGSSERQLLYRCVVQEFSFIGPVGQFMQRLKKELGLA